MAHYAFLDANNIVTEVIVGKNEGEDGVDWEVWYSEFRNQPCKRTSYNTRAGVHYKSDNSAPSDDQSKAFRKNYAGIGFSYDANLDAFIPPKPYSSWVLDEQTCLWNPPTPAPINDKKYSWDENTLSWVELV